MNIFRRLFGGRKKEPREPEPVCLHYWVLNEVYGHWVDLRVEVTVEDRFVLFCTKCKKEKTVDTYDFSLMYRNGLIHEKEVTTQ